MNKKLLFIVNMCCITIQYVQIGYVYISNNDSTAKFLECWGLHWFKELYLICNLTNDYWNKKGKNEVCIFLDKIRDKYKEKFIISTKNSKGSTRSNKIKLINKIQRRRKNSTIPTQTLIDTLSAQSPGAVSSSLPPSLLQEVSWVDIQEWSKKAREGEYYPGKGDKKK